MNPGSEFVVGAALAAAKEQAEKPLEPSDLTPELRKRGRAALEATSSPVSANWLKGLLDGKTPLAAGMREKILGFAQVDPVMHGVIAEMIQQHDAAIAETSRREYEAAERRRQAERQRQIDERNATWAALPRRAKELDLLEERFEAAPKATIVDFVKALRRLEALTDDELSAPPMIPWETPMPPRGRF